MLSGGEVFDFTKKFLRNWSSFLEFCDFHLVYLMQFFTMYKKICYGNTVCDSQIRISGVFLFFFSNLWTLCKSTNNPSEKLLFHFDER